MDTFYAHTATSVEVQLESLLLPGTYTVDLTLDDAAQNVLANSGTIALIVEAPALTAPGATEAAGLAPVIEASGAQVPPLWVAFLVAALVIATGLLSFDLLRRRRPRIPTL